LNFWQKSWDCILLGENRITDRKYSTEIVKVISKILTLVNDRYMEHELEIGNIFMGIRKIQDLLPMVNLNFLEYKWNGFYVGVFSYFGTFVLVLQPIEIGAQISPPNKPIRRLQNRKPPTWKAVPKKFLFTTGRVSLYYSDPLEILRLCNSPKTKL